MIEIFNIIYQLVLMFVIFNFPFNLYNIKKVRILNNLDLFEIIKINLLIFLYIFLISSFFKVNFTFIILLILFFSLFFNFISLIRIIRNISNNEIKFLFIFFISAFILSVSLVSNLFLEWDGQIWIYKAINFY